jgi:hypothetical protein
MGSLGVGRGGKRRGFCELIYCVMLKNRTKKRKYHACCQEERKTKTTYRIYI